MDYEKKYKEALEKIRSLHRDYNQISTLIDVKEELENIFPELAESEGEGIRKALLEMVHDTTGDSLWVDYNVHKEDAIAWLEKQGEQKSAEEYNITGIGSKNAQGKLREMIKNLKPVNEVLEQKPWSEEEKEKLIILLLCSKTVQ